MDGRPKRKRPFFKCFLLLLLIGAVALNFFVFRHADDMFDMPGPAPTQQQQQQQRVGRNGLPQMPPTVMIGAGGPAWHGEAAVTKLDKGLADVTISPLDNMGKPIALTSYQVYISATDGKNEEEITSLFKMDKDGILTGEIKDHAAGPAQLRIRLHRALSTFEFTQPLDLK